MISLICMCVLQPFDWVPKNLSFFFLQAQICVDILMGVDDVQSSRTEID
jgi:hypothetical protein